MDDPFYDRETVTDALYEALERFSAERERHFSQYDQNVCEKIEQIDAFAASIMRGIQSVASDNATPAEQLCDFDESALGELGEHFTDLLFESLKIGFTRQVLKTAREGGKRLYVLLIAAKRAQVSRRGEQFLRRVGRCYLFGFDPECIVMCRSVLDAAFEAAVPNDDCIEALGSRPGSRAGEDGMFQLVDRIAVALKRGRISQEIADRAHRVRKRGRDAVHRDPSVDYQSTIATLYDTLEVIEHLPS